MAGSQARYTDVREAYFSSSKPPPIPPKEERRKSCGSQSRPLLLLIVVVGVCVRSVYNVYVYVYDICG